MQKIAISWLLITQLFYFSAPAQAMERYTQIYTIPNQQTREGASLPSVQVAQIQGHVQTSSTLNSPQAILDRLEAANQIPAEASPTLKIERSDTLNAATDGKNLIITDGLLNKLRTNDERAFVISHELAHILLSHIGKTQVRRTGLSLLNFFLSRKVGENSVIAMASRLGINLVDLKSSRGYEYQADDLGVQLMVKAGYNPQAAIQVFDILEANAPSRGQPGFLLSHPISRDRIEALVKKHKLTLR
jgi:predicted Zn-dependent protease